MYDDSSRGDRGSGRDGQTDDDEHSRHETDRTSLFSLASSASGDRVEDLERENAELSKKLQELQRALEDGMASHELEMEELHMQMEEIEAELASSQRDEKDLRMKDVSCISLWMNLLHIYSSPCFSAPFIKTVYRGKFVAFLLGKFYKF